VAETLLNQQELKLAPSPGTQRPNSYLKRTIGIILSLVMIALTIYMLNLQNQSLNILSKSTDMALIAGDHATANYRTYVGRYKETKIELDETTRKLEEVNRQLDQVTTELATTKGMLFQAEGMLSEAQQENLKLKQDLRGLDDLSNRNAQVSLQLAQLKSQLRVFQAEFSNLDEGKSLIVLFQNKIKFIKSRMRYLKQEAFFTRVEVQKEKDRLAVLNGNSGFILRNGQMQNPNGAKKSFAIDVKIVP
jgi:septal ring factor EnvC (AmiA/AmiB activator)